MIPFVHYRLNEGLEYEARFLPALETVPSGDPEADTRAINEAIEQMIAPHPLRYWWAIKRFKHRPPGEAKVY